MSIQTWFEGLIKTAVDEAVKDLHDELAADLRQFETNLVGQIAQLPGLVASQVGHVVVDVERLAQQVAQQVIDAINPFGKQ